ncbi:hypothetical protein SDC9_200756 [bioreactor metagenome]|uniref:Uncharacterized protein n=1 Tax=bioreactor metagenome TaxID=1076179 RepID=A0A645IQD2_9ZZZZ
MACRRIVDVGEQIGVVVGRDGLRLRARHEGGGVERYRIGGCGESLQQICMGCGDCLLRRVLQGAGRAEVRA